MIKTREEYLKNLKEDMDEAVSTLPSTTPTEDEVYSAITENKEPSAAPTTAPEASTTAPTDTDTKEEPEKTDYQKLYEAALDYQKQYLEREFDYDVNADELYKTYRQQALDTADRLQRNTTAQAAGLTGGYGSSYAAAVGADAAAEYMRDFDETVPQELYDAAYARYQNEGEELLKKAEVANAYGDTLLQNSEEYQNILATAAAEEQEAANFEMAQKLTGKKLAGGKTPEETIQEAALTMSGDELKAYLMKQQFEDGTFMTKDEVEYLVNYGKNYKRTIVFNTLKDKNGYTPFAYAENLFNNPDLTEEDILSELENWKGWNGKTLTPEDIEYIIEAIIEN